MRFQARFSKHTFRHVKMYLTGKSILLLEYSFSNRKNFRVYTAFVTLSNYIKTRSKCFIQNFFRCLIQARDQKRHTTCESHNFVKTSRSTEKLSWHMQFHFLYKVAEKNSWVRGGVSPPLMKKWVFKHFLAFF